MVVLRFAILWPEAIRVTDTVKPVAEVAKVLVDPVSCADHGPPIATTFSRRYVGDIGDVQPCETMLARPVEYLRLVLGSLNAFGIVGQQDHFPVHTLERLCEPVSW